jgi:hypothetical protein
MTFNDFANKLKDIQIEFKKSRGVELKTIKELEQFIMDKKNIKLSVGAKTLRGLIL